MIIIIVVLDTTRMKILMSLRDRTAERRGVTVKRLCVTNVTGLLLACFVMIFSYINGFWSFTKRYVWRRVKFGKNFFQTKLLSHLSHRVCHLFSLALCISSLLLDNTWKVAHNERYLNGWWSQELQPRAVILLPLHPASLTHKNPQKIICDMCHIGHKDQIIDLKMSGLTVTICNKITARAKYNHGNTLSGIHPEALSHFWPASGT